MFHGLSIALLATGTKAFAPAPIRWGGLSSNKFIVDPHPSSFRNRGTASLLLTIGDPPGRISSDVLPYFSAQPDNTITWNTRGMRMCMEASGFTSGQKVGVNRCKDGASQRWKWLPWGPIQLKGTNQCLDIALGKGGLNGAPIELRECDNEKASEIWKFEHPIAQSIENHSTAARHAMAILTSMVVFGMLSVGAWLRLSQKKVYVEAMIDRGDNGGGVCLTTPSAAWEGSKPFIFFSDHARQGIAPAVMAQSPAHMSDQDPEAEVPNQGVFLQTLVPWLSGYRIVLASASPRRREILSNLLPSLEVIPSTFAEDIDKDSVSSAAAYVEETAKQKGLEVHRKESSPQNPCLTISADTVVVDADGNILEKPVDAEHAANMLQSLSGKCHSVITGVALFRGDSSPHVFSEVTIVEFCKLSPGDIAAYIATDEPFDKAGGYGIQGYGGTFVRSITGCYFNVVGFPQHRFFRELHQYTSSRTSIDVIFVLGGPGTGKGTQCDKIIAHYEQSAGGAVAAVSAGDCLRNERKNNPDSADAQLIEERIKVGGIVPVEITLRLLLKAMKASGAKRILVDGFPRNQDNVDGWTKLIKDLERGAFQSEDSISLNLKGVLYFSLSEDKMVERVLARAAKQAAAGEAVRADDNEETIRKRLRTNSAEGEPIVKMYREQGILAEVDASGGIDEVWEVTKAAVGKWYGE